MCGQMRPPLFEKADPGFRGDLEFNELLLLVYNGESQNISVEGDAFGPLPTE